MQSKADWLDYLTTLDPHQIKLGLERVQQIASPLQLASFSCPVITVTGTNGKGSTVTFLEQIYLAAGYRTGAYISPHLLEFNERIRVLGQNIDDATLIEAFAAIEKARAEIPLTYFEFTTLAALKIFQGAELDILILEVGLGGRLDAVNIVDADLAIITNIGIDHTEWLGKTRASIAIEKAGIFRSQQLAVCGDSNPPTVLLQKAHDLNVDLHIFQREFFYEATESDWQWRSNGKLSNRINHLPLPQLPIANAASALMAITLLQNKLPVTANEMRQGLQMASLPARFQQQGPFIFDVAHNPHAAAWLAQRLQKESHHGRTLAVVGMLADKDIYATLENLKGLIDIWFVGGLDHHSRGASAEVMCHNLTRLGISQWHRCATVSEAFKIAKQTVGTTDRVIIFGSFYTVAECMELLGDNFGH